jgi:hypothetical protein
MQRLAQIGRVLRSTAVIALVPAALFGQGRGGGGRGGFGRGRGAGNLAKSDGITVQMPINPVNLLIEHRQELTLSDTQFVHIIAVKRSLDSANAPLMRRIDSVQHTLKGGSPIFSEPNAARRDSLSEGRAVVQETLAGVRENISDFREKAFSLLSTQQLAKATDIETTAQKAADDEEEKAKGRGGKP